MFCLCAALAICCESLRATLLQTSAGTESSWHDFKRGRGDAGARASFLLTCACLPGPPWALSVSFSLRPNDSRLLQGGKRSAGNVTFVRSGKWGHKLNIVLSLLNQRPGHAWWKRHKDYCYSWLFFLMLHGSSSCAPESVFTVCLRSRQWTRLQIHTCPLL